mmetsp:Transcript_17870/g.55462  ORF Transcript_17870/g.55462 Transcript_17870/m.55462 type:complete len:221 (-) Transcript_17870:545-1207(-)
MFASSACAVQMFDVALARLMCCSRVWSAMRRARRPFESMETPMMRPGRKRLCASLHAKKAGCGPPKPSGIPRRWPLPKTKSAPISPGGFKVVHVRSSVAQHEMTPFFAAAAKSSEKSRIAPLRSGVWTTMAASFGSAGSHSLARSPTTISARFVSPMRERIISIDAAKQRRSTKILVRFFWRRCAWMPMEALTASAAAVASSSRDALASSMPVSSVTAVW